MRQRRWVLAGALSVLALAGAGVAWAGHYHNDVNSSVRVGDGETRDGDLTTVNGRITVGDNVVVRGRCTSVNGGITLGMNGRMQAVTAVNGGVRIGAGTEVSEEVSSVNGSVTLDDGSRAGEAGTVNGEIRLTNARIAGDVHTVNGDIGLLRGSVIEGSIVIKESHGRNNSRREPLRIDLEDGSEVRGDIIVEDPDLEVEVHVAGGSRIGGRVQNAKVIRD
jgi:DUF4097 and DUF4098 domain-containing protein YvlB